MALKSTDRRVDELELDKQDNLVSGVNIKTINGNSVLGSGNLTIGGGGSATWGGITGTLSSQTDLQSALDAKQDDLISGTNIKTLEGQSLLGAGNIDLTKSDVGLSNVDNTSDLNKPISTLTQTALNAKQDTLTLTTTGTSGAATLVGATLNIPQYSGGGGGGLKGVHALVDLASNDITFAQIGGANMTSTAMVTNRITLSPFIPNQDITTVTLDINVSSFQLASSAKIVIYSNLNGLPNSLIYESAILSCTTNGIKTATTTQTFTAGTTYWIGIFSLGGATLTSMNASQMFPIKMTSTTSNTVIYQNLTFGSAPASFGTPTGYLNFPMHLIRITKA